VDCEFSAPEGTSIRQAERELVAKYQRVIELLHSGSSAESAGTLQKIREADNAADAVNAIADAQLLLSVTSSSAVSTLRHEVPEILPAFASIGRGNRRLTSPLGP